MILWAAGLKATAAWTISTETEAAGIKKGNYVQGTVCLVLRKRAVDEPGFLDEVYPLVEDEVKRQIASMQALDEDGEPNFNDSDYQLAAYAAALKVLTQYSNIDGRDVEHEVFAVRARNEKSDFQIVIERALGIACDYLVPRGLDYSWRDLSLSERYYLRALDKDARIEAPVLKDIMGKDAKGKDPVLILSFDFWNTDDRRILRFKEDNPFLGSHFKLRDDVDNVIRGVSYGIGSKPKGALTSSDDIEPGKSASHIEFFSVPPPKTQFLILTIDLECLGGEGEVEFKIPANAIQQ